MNPPPKAPADGRGTAKHQAAANGVAAAAGGGGGGGKKVGNVKPVGGR